MSDIKITTWNINSVRLRINQVTKFLQDESPDVLTLQEIKCQNDQFPYQPLRDIGYEHIEVSGQKGYHGTATVSKLPLERMNTQFCPVGEARHVSTHVIHESGPFEVHNFYVPAGGDEADIEINPKFKHKMDFLEAMRAYFKTRANEGGDTKLVLTGDFNIAPHEHDVWSHKQLLKVVSHTPLEVETLAKLQATHDFTDVARAITPEDEKLFSWWSYRSRDINKSDRGRRLDHIWVSPALKSQALKYGKNSLIVHRDCRFWERPSDHAPVTLTLKL